MMSRRSRGAASAAAVRVFAFVATVTFAAACSRAVAVESQPGIAYTVVVQNDAGQPLVVSYEDSRGSALLGTVDAGATQRFVISSPSSASVTIVGRPKDGGTTFQKQVTLSRTQATSVRLGS